LLKLLN